MNIDGIENGIVLDHIKAGKSMLVYQYLGLQNLNSPVALIQNCSSGKMGKKDIVKIAENIDLDLNVLGYIDPGITVNYIRDGKRVDKDKRAKYFYQTLCGKQMRMALILKLLGLDK